MKTLLGVIGRPILHSKSPLLHTAAMKSVQVNGASIRLAASDVAEAFRAAREIGIGGLNVTAPFKEEAFRLSDETDDMARALRASNTVLFGEIIRSWNTDVYGVAEAFRANGVNLWGKKAVILGAGAAARAAACALFRAGAEVSIVNRTLEKAIAIAREFRGAALSLTDPNLERTLAKSEVVVSCLSTPEPVLPPGLLQRHHVVLDAIYGKETALTRAANEKGARCISGLDWLLFQGAKSFEHFLGVAPSMEAMKESLTLSSSPRPRAVALVGMPASGKTKVARALSGELGMQALDMDHEIEAAAEKSVTEIFRDSGEETFREMETSMLERLGGREDIVLSTGGGIVLREENRRILRDHFFTVWLWVPNLELAERVRGDTTRPLLAGGDSKAKLEKLFAERRDLYAEAADVVVTASGSTVEERAKRIAYEMRAAGIC